MPRFLSQQDIPLKLRHPHMERYRRILREGLHNPGISPQQKEEILYKLAHLGEPKNYSALSKMGSED